MQPWKMNVRCAEESGHVWFDMLFWYFPGTTEWKNKQLSGQSFSKPWSTTGILWTQTSSNSQWHTQNLFVYLFIYLFIYHPFATSIAFGKVKQSIKKERNKYSPTFLQELHYVQSTNLQESWLNCTSAINYDTMNYVINYEDRVCLFIYIYLFIYTSHFTHAQ